MKKSIKLKFAAVVAAAVLIMCAAVFGTSAALIYDINGDGEVDVIDCTQIQKYITGLTDSIDKSLADVNGDGSIDIMDSTLLAKYLVNLVEPPAHAIKQPTKVSLSKKSLTLKVGAQNKLTASADVDCELKFTSSNSSIVAISESTEKNTVTLKPMKLGTCTVTATASNGIKASCSITVSGSAAKCIDVSEWQDDIDFKKVKAAGINYVVIRAGYGRETYQKDSSFETNYKAAKAAGLKVGAYWFSYAKSSSAASAEADACLYCLGNKTFDLPVYYDMEYEPAITSMSKSEYTKMAVTFCEKIKKAGHVPGVYASASVLKNELDLGTLRGKGYSIWNAEWGSKCTVDCDLWQHSSTGKVDGITTVVDIDYFNNLNIVK